jgi:alcohol dehydrogenase (cytochrome c)
VNPNRNGFLYVIDRTDGKLIAANQFVKTMNWATGVDKNGRPIESELTKQVRATEKTAEIWPSVWGAKAWSPSSFNPKTGLLYANTLEFGMTYTPTRPQYRAGTTYWGADLAWVFPKDGNVGYLKAIEPMTGKAKWEVTSKTPRWGGVLTTSGGIVFSGQSTGEFEAFDADSGEKLWQFQTGSGIEGQPVTWQQDGVQYVAVAVGHGGAYVVYAGDERLKNVPAGGSLWVFALTPKASQ